MTTLTDLHILHHILWVYVQAICQRTAERHHILWRQKWQHQLLTRIRYLLGSQLITALPGHVWKDRSAMPSAKQAAYGSLSSLPPSPHLLVSTQVKSRASSGPFAAQQDSRRNVPRLKHMRLGGRWERPSEETSWSESTSGRAPCRTSAN